ncbi:MAG: hypothetical protein ACFFAY_14490 [Promethearchaeota archaeon]
MKHRIFTIAAIIVLSLMLFQSASGHVPVTGEPGESLDTATEIADPTKSYVIYSEIHNHDEAQYFTFEMGAGTRLRMTLMIPTEFVSTSFRPTLVLMGHGLTNSSNVSDHLEDHIEIPSDVGIVVFDEALMHPEYEGFTPSSFYLLESVDIIVPETGDYYLAVYDETSHGRYAITIGYVESFTFDEWLLVPINVIGIHLWEGQNLFLILAPILITVPLGIIFIYRRQEEGSRISNPFTWIGFAGSLLIVGSGILMFHQMIVAALNVPINAQAVITAIFAMLPILMGYFGLRIGIRLDRNATTSDGMKMILVAVLSLFVWGGLLLGPALLVVVGVLFLLQKKQE